MYFFFYYSFIYYHLFIYFTLFLFLCFCIKGKDAVPKLIFQEQKLSSDRLKRKLKRKELDWYQRDRQLEVNRAYRDACHLPPKKEPVRSA